MYRGDFPQSIGTPLSDQNITWGIVHLTPSLPLSFRPISPHRLIEGTKVGEIHYLKVTQSLDPLPSSFLNEFFYRLLIPFLIPSS